MIQDQTELLHAIPPDHELADGTCAACGQSLRGLTRRSRCPECGERVEDSLRTHLLDPSDVAWAKRRRERRSFRPLRIIIAICLLLGLALILMTCAGGPAAPPAAGS
ncbi:MAG: hypothetical protein AB8G96_01050 [Phycisphaerales bacterium]